MTMKSCQKIVTSLSFSGFLANLEQSVGRIPDTEPVKVNVFNKSNLLSYKIWKHNYKISNTALTLLLWVKVLFWTKNANFLQKDADITKIKGA